MTAIPLRSVGRIPIDYSAYWMQSVQNDIMALRNSIISNSSFLNPVIVTAVAYSAAITDTLMLANATGGAITITLPSAITYPGLVMNVVKTDATANTVTIDPSGAETINGSANLIVLFQWSAVEFASTGIGWVIL